MDRFVKSPDREALSKSHSCLECVGVAPANGVVRSLSCNPLVVVFFTLESWGGGGGGGEGRGGERRDPFRREMRGGVGEVE